jgi:predicted unusual protein kinase regulating ubiquinone biosynthesis (AarF/ABC1/UbiB family)
VKSRYRRILRFAAFALIQTWWFELVLPKFGLKRWVAARRIARYRAMARRFSVLAASLGGLIIKAGQFASSRLDVLPAAITAELESLQDDVAPEPFDTIRALIDNELSMPFDLAFAEFDESPIAAASLGQAYRARLAPSLANDFGVTNVVIKVLRPGIEDIVEVDLRALRRIGGWLSRIKLIARRTDAPALVDASGPRHPLRELRLLPLRVVYRASMRIHRPSAAFHKYTDHTVLPDFHEPLEQIIAS